MKDKNGYSITEVLAVITIISIVAILTVSISVSILEKTKRRISDYDKTILVDAAIAYGEDLDKNDGKYTLTNDVTINGQTYAKDTQISGYTIKELVKTNNTLPVSTEYLYQNKYLGESYEKCSTDSGGISTCALKEQYQNCTINIQFDTSIQDGYIVVNKISAKLGEDCK